MERIVGGRRVSWVIVLLWTAACVQQSEPDSAERVQGQLTGFTGVLTQHNDLARTGANLPTGGTTSCAAGVCKPACSAGATLCGTACVITATDVNNCGGCGVTCAIGASCTAGACSAAACTTTNALIDDFEDGNNQISVREGRNGADYTYADTTGSTITPTAGSTFVPGTPGNGTSTRAAHFNGTLSGATTVWAGMGMDFLAPKGVYNASKYTGISFFAKKASTTSNGAVRVKVPDRNTDPTGAICTSCSNDFGVDLTLTAAWTKYTIPFSGMTQQADGARPARPRSIPPAWWRSSSRWAPPGRSTTSGSTT